MNQFLGFILILYGLFMMFYPIVILDIKHMFSIKGQREYTDFAVGGTRFAGFVILIFALLLIFNLI